MATKSFQARVKAAGPDDGLNDGEFRALVSVFGNRDLVGDVVMPGAFEKTLQDWQESGAPIPVLWGHRFDDPDYNIGHVLGAEETDKGLEVHAALDLENAKAAQVYRLLKGRRVKEFSFAYDIEDAQPGKLDGEPVNELHAVKLHEVSVVPLGANPDTELLAVKAGRVLSAKNEDLLRQAHDAIGAVLAALDQTSDGKATGSAPAKDEEPDGAKSEEPRLSPGVARLIAELELLSA
jgi:HK97 family phage prohead protease